jgi:hypothetical protein
MEELICDRTDAFRMRKPQLNRILEQLATSEARARDEAQLAASEASLQEARKSIEVAQVSIQEGKRVKLLTILAFFFLPLTLATSIFGMNIKQLSGEGPSLTAFGMTAAARLSASTITWMASYQMNIYMDAEMNGDFGMEHTTSSRAVRAYWRLFIRLHWISLFRSGIVFSLLSGGRVGFFVCWDG